MFKGFGFKGLGFRVEGYLFWGPHNKENIILGSILGSPYFGKLPDDHTQIPHNLT